MKVLRLTFSFGAGVGFVVDFGQMVEIEFGVDLGGGEVAVAEQFLYGADVAGGLQQVAGVAVAQHVRGEVLRAALLDGPVAQAVLDLAGAQAAASVVDKQGGFLSVGGLALWQVAADGFDALCDEGDLALFIAFAGYADPAFGQMQVVQVELLDFGQAQAGAVHEFENGMVAQGDGFRIVVVVEQVVEGFLFDGFGQAGGRFGGFQAFGGVAVEQLLFDEPAAVLSPDG